MTTDPAGGRRATTRERILTTAYDLFSRRGIRAVGVDEIIARSGVAKATLYRHFPSKNDLVLAFLDDRERRWTRGVVEAGARQRAETPLERLLAVFDVFDSWFHHADFEGCSFISVLLEMGPEHPAGTASTHHLANIRILVERWAEEGGLRDPVEFAHSWHLLAKGSIIAAAEGDRTAARRARRMAHHLIDEHRPR
ncbi:TetR/AcrR family transcriptional regulator [Saccharopolyspora sp. K220]|uniref:TetR/AcrR family transcriptional regulator n=1 Tax=Saccharopolyspora soli TaxID=2926618 RepID=UPI001F57F588|nr:TetR/AcrR family transcriptional regulator [Saccharopolyspora soli]MCI2416427.1 TetR/AcrR family transcriptional regulator [Saccharopolyspora soli]